MNNEYKLINKSTKEETICTKVVIDGFDYYVSDDKILNDEPYISLETNYATDPKERYVLYYLGVGLNGKNPKKVIATNNPSIDIGQVIDEVVELADKWVFKTNGHKWSNNDDTAGDNYSSFIEGYNTHAKTHTLSDDEVVEFGNTLLNMPNNILELKTVLEHLQLFKEQQIKTIYYGE